MPIFVDVCMEKQEKRANIMSEKIGLYCNIGTFPCNAYKVVV